MHRYIDWPLPQVVHSDCVASLSIDIDDNNWPRPKSKAQFSFKSQIAFFIQTSSPEVDTNRGLVLVFAVTKRIEFSTWIGANLHFELAPGLGPAAQKWHSSLRLIINLSFISSSKPALEPHGSISLVCYCLVDCLLLISLFSLLSFYPSLSLKYFQFTSISLSFSLSPLFCFFSKFLLSKIFRVPSAWIIALVSLSIWLASSCLVKLNKDTRIRHQSARIEVSVSFNGGESFQ